MLRLGFLLAIGCCAVLPLPLLAQTRNVSGGELGPGRAAYDAERYVLELKVEPELRTIEGRLVMEARVLEPCSWIRMDLDEALSVRKVFLGKQAATFEHRGHQLKIQLGREAKVGEGLSVAVSYGGKPRVAPQPPWKGGFTWSKTPAGAPWIATSCQGEGADLWWPCKDHPSDEPRTMDLFIEVPAALTVASNGTLKGISADEKAGTRQFHWHIANPINVYTVALNIAPYVELKESFASSGGEKVPVSFWVLPGNEEKGRQLLPEILDHLKFMESVCGPYPFRNEKYGVVETPHLGMEHQTIIAYGNKFRGLRRGYDWLHLHELSHEWWGNLVTNRDWKDMWIHEGFGTYIEALYLERKKGKPAYRREMAKKRGHTNRMPVAPRANMDSAGIYFGGGGNDIYFKGSWILHTLRWTLGDAIFFRCIRRMAYPDPKLEKVTDGSQCRHVTTQDFIDIVNREAKRDMTWFFEVYVRRAAPPELLSEEKDGQLELRWQVGDGCPPCEVPVPIKIGETVHRVAMPKGQGHIALPAGAQAKIDPESWLLKKLQRRGRRR